MHRTVFLSDKMDVVCGNYLDSMLLGELEYNGNISALSFKNLL